MSSAKEQNNEIPLREEARQSWLTIPWMTGRPGQTDDDLNIVSMCRYAALH